MARLLLLLAAVTVAVARGGSNVEVFPANLTVGDRTYYCVKIPALVTTAGGVVLASGEGRVGNCGDVATTDLIYRRSFDGGMTWTDTAVLFSNSSDAESNVVGNAAPVLDATTGRLFVFFNRNNRETWLTFSDDDGATFSAPRAMPDLQAEDWVWVGLGPPAGVQLQSGRLLVPGYHGKVPMSDQSSLGSAFTHGHTLVSDDHGASWRIGCADFGGDHFVNELQAAQLANGTIVVNARELKDRRALSWSDDEGESFPVTVEAPTLHETYQGCEGSTIAASGGDRLLYAGVQGLEPERLWRQNLTVIDSVDGGASWQLREVVDAGSAAYSALLHLESLDDGTDRVGILYERANCTDRQCPLVFLPDQIVWRELVV